MSHKFVAREYAPTARLPRAARIHCEVRECIEKCSFIDCVDVFSTAITSNSVGCRMRREKVVVLSEVRRAIIYTRELSKQAIEGHVNTAFTVYSVKEGARLTSSFQSLALST
jgi:hypothetical protein